MSSVLKVINSLNICLTVEITGQFEVNTTCHLFTAKLHFLGSGTSLKASKHHFGSRDVNG